MTTQDIQGIPDVDLGAIVEDLKNQEEEKAAKVEIKEIEEKKQDLAQFKTPEDLLKGYKELQGAYTRASQKNKELDAKIKDIEERMVLSQQQPVQQENPAQFNDQYLENPHAAVQAAVLRQRIQETLEEEQEKNPQEFMDRYGFAQRVISQYPQLAQSGRGVAKAFQLGDKLRKDALKQSTSMALESVFGGPLSDEEITRLQKLIKGDKDLTQIKTNLNDAYMPDTSTSTRQSSTTERKVDSKSVIAEKVDKGDVDGVLSEMFRNIMAE